MTKRHQRAGFVVDKRDADGMTLLMTAAQTGEYQCLLECLESCADINAVDNAGNNALIHAVRAKQDTIAVVLMNKGIDPAKQTSGGTTALIEACASQLPEVIERLLKKKVPLNAQNRSGNTALMVACLLNDGWAACRIAEEGADFETLKNKKDMTALAIARTFMKRDDLVCFEEVIEKRRAAQRLVDQAAAEERAKTLEKNVEEATILQRAIKPMKPVALKLKPQ
ncbi:MAG: ankyrin repeat domain-containing protein [Alphaproteobacteria bacterium]